MVRITSPSTDDWMRALMVLARVSSHGDGSAMPMLLMARVLWHLRLKE